MPKQAKAYALGSGPVPKRLVEEADLRGWAPTESCIELSERRVIYEIDKEAGTRRAVAVVGKEFANQAKIVPLFLKDLEERRRDAAATVVVSDIVTTDEIASRVRLNVKTIQKWTSRYRGDFPDPIIEYTWLNLYDWTQVMTWLEKKFPAYAARVAGKYRLVDG